MICNKCGKENPAGTVFCPNCGNRLISEQVVTNSPVTPVTNTVTPAVAEPKKGFDKKQKTIIIALGCIVLILLAVAVFALGGGGNKRTVMIYIVGSNLETDHEIVTADLAAIKPENINLDKTNILLYTGGTKKWHNFVSNQDNGIYLLKADGFEKLESQQQYNLGDPETLTNFMKYAYNNYKADKYDLVLYDHGGAIDGAIYDDISNDNLSLEDMVTALKNSPFNEKNKLDAVLFRTCLNGTIELANVFAPYSKYLIGSEEVSWGAKSSNVLSFLNEVVETDTGAEFGTKYIKSYKRQMTEIDPFESVKYTYSVIDLSKINRVNKELDEYISGLDLTKNYNDVVKVRTAAYQYGQDVPSYDMIDLYNFISETSKYSGKDSKKLLAAIDDAVVYNLSNETNSHGLSIYLPYNGKKGQKMKFVEEVYSHLTYSENYKNFIKAFSDTRTNSKPFSFAVSDSNVVDSKNEYELEIQLTDEQKANYAFSTFTIFEQDKEHKNYYKPIFNTDKTTLDDNGILKVNYENSLTKVHDDDTGKDHYALTYYRKNGDTRFIYGILYDTDLDISEDAFMQRATLYLANKDDKLFVSTAILNSENERINGAILKLEDYEKYEIWNYTYRILDDKGNTLPTNEWEGAPVLTGISGKVSDFELSYANLDKGDNYYALFIITDMNGNASYSKLIKVGE